MPDIELIRGNTTTHEVTIVGGPDKEAKAGDKVKWKVVGNNSNIYSFEIVPKKGSVNIWSKHPNRDDRDKWKGEISDRAKETDTFRYYIIWQESKDGPDHIHDPIISIRPSGIFGLSSVFIFLLIAIAMAGLFTFGFVQRKRNRNKGRMPGKQSQ